MTANRPNDARETVFVDVAAVAEHLAVTPGWVYAHADELGARRLGNGPRARLRFSLPEVDEWLNACSTSRESEAPKPAPQAASRQRRRRRMGTGSESVPELLPIRGRIGLREAV